MVGLVNTTTSLFRGSVCTFIPLLGISFSNDTKHGVLNAGKPQDFGNVGMRRGDRGKKIFPKLERVVLAVLFGEEQVLEGDAKRVFSVSSASNRTSRATRQGPMRERSDAVVAPYASIASKADLLAADAARDIALCGRSLCEAAPVHPDLASACAHEPTPTPYFVLEELLGKLGLTANDHLLDVGCGTGRVLAYAASQLPCRATGVELDTRLANIASSWSASFPQLDVIAGSVLDISLAPYTCFYLFNPFDTAVLTRFLDKAEREAARPFTLVHMSDNGESFAYLGRSGWRLVRSGSIQMFQTASGRNIKFYEFPQHYSVWRYEGVK